METQMEEDRRSNRELGLGIGPLASMKTEALEVGKVLLIYLFSVLVIGGVITVLVIT